MSWTDERCTLLRKLWADGLSASQVAAELGGVTRNAVIGKLHRLGFNREHQPAPKTKRKPRQPTRLAAQRSIIRQALDEAQPVEPIDAAALMPEAQRRSLLELTADCCRWPVGEPATADFFFCGGAVLQGLSYCAYHTRVAYQPAAERRRVSRRRGWIGWRDGHQIPWDVGGRAVQSA